MIGKGAQYLTAAGFGRYRITAASLGSLDLLDSIGWLRWATRQAIMDAFGVDGTAVIRATNEYLNGIAASDKAKATALAGFINEQDYLIVCSLPMQQYLPQGFTMPTRWIESDGNCWIDTGFYANSTDWEISAKIKPLNNIAVNDTMLGMLSSLPNIVQFLYCYPNVNKTDFHFGTRDVQADFTKGVEHIVSFAPDGTMTIDGTDYNVGTVQRTFADSFGTIPLFAYRLSGGINYKGHYGSGNVFDLRVGTQHGQFIPCIHKTLGNGMLDLVAVEFHEKKGSGSFTIPDISYTPTP